MERELLDNIDHSVQTRPSSPTPEVAAPLPGLLALQRLAGNRAVSAMIARRTAEPAAEESAATTEPDTSLQRLATRTGLKTAHAQKVLYNHLKGDPPFKPQRGNFGQVSWFAGSGNPYVGGQAQSYDVTVDVVINPDPAKLDKEYFQTFKREYVQSTRANLHNTSTHHDFWVALGKRLERGGAQEVPIDQSEVSRQGGGTFVVVGGSARESITLANPVKLATDLGGSQTMTNSLAARENQRAATFAVTLRAPAAQAANAQPQQALATVVSQPQAVTRAVAQVAAVTMADRLAGPKVDITFTLTYPSYQVARRQAKLLATAVGDGRLNAYRVTITGGAGWSASATKSYRA